MTTKSVTEEKSLVQTGKDEKRKLILPGEKVINSIDFLPGRNCFREGNSIYSKKLGMVQTKNRVISVIPLSGVYIAKAGDMVIGEIIDIQSNGWVVNVNSVHDGYLPLSGVRDFIDTSRTELSSVYALGDVIYAKISGASGDSIHLSMQDARSRKFTTGRVAKISPVKVPRLIGKEGSMINIVKDKTKCKISVGQNGLIWLEGENEDKAIEIFRIIDEEAQKDGLTDRISKMFKGGKK